MDVSYIFLGNRFGRGQSYQNVYVFVGIERFWETTAEKDQQDILHVKMKQPNNSK